MRLGEFIVRDMERILRAWESFIPAKFNTAISTPDSQHEIRRDVLQAIVGLLASPTPSGALSGSSRKPAAATGTSMTASKALAVSRAESGFSIEQLASEYGALRVFVLGVWMEACLPSPPLFADILRFNEAIDDALVESISAFAAHVARARSLLFGMLSHDLRSPLQTIQMTARALEKLHGAADVGRAAGLLARSSSRMQELLNDQIDLHRSELGLRIGIRPRESDLGLACAEELEQIRAAFAERQLVLKVLGDCRGCWDTGRIQQLLNNLVVNAVHYGEPRKAINVVLRGCASNVSLTVTNTGETIDGATLSYLFEPMRRGNNGASRYPSGLGLGLYIASEIAKAHGGSIEAESKRHRTVFTVNLPKTRALRFDMSEDASEATLSIRKARLRHAEVQLEA